VCMCVCVCVCVREREREREREIVGEEPTIVSLSSDFLLFAGLQVTEEEATCCAVLALKVDMF